MTSYRGCSSGRAWRRQDPLRGDPSLAIGKIKRVRAVLGTAVDRDRKAGARLVQSLVRAVRAYSGFQRGSDNYVGDDLLAEAQRAFADIGYELSPDGAIHPRRLEELEGAELTDALWAYVRRAREGAGDDALVVGTDKDLLEAVARHALVESTGGYATRENLTIYQAFERLELSPGSAVRVGPARRRRPVRRPAGRLPPGPRGEPPSQRARDGARSPCPDRPHGGRLEDRLPRDGARV